MESTYNYLSQYWDNTVYPLVSSRYDSFSALAERTEPLSVSLQNALLTTKDASLAWMRVCIPFLVFLLQRFIWIMSHILRFTNQGIRWCWPHIKTGVSRTKSYFEGLDRRTKIILVGSLVSLILIIILFRQIARSKWLARLVTAYRNMRSRMEQRYRDFIQSVAEKSRIAAYILPHLLFASMVVFLHLTLLSNATWLSSFPVIFAIAFVLPFANTVHALASFFYLPSSEWQQAIVRANIPVDKDTSTISTYVSFHIRVARVLYTSPRWLNAVRATLISEAEYVCVLALLYAAWLQPVLGHALHYTARWPIVPVACLAWLRLPLTGGAALMVRLLRHATVLYDAADATFGEAVNTVAEHVIHADEQEGKRAGSTKKPAVESPKADTVARKSWIESALSLPILPSMVRSGLLSLHREGGLLLLPCVFFFFTPSFLTFYATVVAGLVRPAYALLYTLPKAQAALAVIQARATGNKSQNKSGHSSDDEDPIDEATDANSDSNKSSRSSSEAVQATPSRFARLVSYFTPRSATTAVSRINRPTAQVEPDLFSLDAHREVFEPLAVALATALMCASGHLLFCYVQSIRLVSVIPLLSHAMLALLFWMQLPWYRGSQSLLAMAAPYLRTGFEITHASYVDTEADPSQFSLDMGQKSISRSQLQSVQKKSSLALLPAVKPLMVLASPLLGSVTRRRHASRIPELNSESGAASATGAVPAESYERLPDQQRVELQPYRAEDDSYLLVDDHDLQTPMRNRTRGRMVPQNVRTEEVLEDVVEENEEDLREEYVSEDGVPDDERVSDEFEFVDDCDESGDGESAVSSSKNDAGRDESAHD